MAKLPALVGLDDGQRRLNGGGRDAPGELANDSALAGEEHRAVWVGHRLLEQQMQGVRVNRGAELLEAPLEFTGPVARIDLRQRESDPNVLERPSRLDERLQSALHDRACRAGLAGATGREEFRLLTSAHLVVEAVDERAAPDLLFFVEGRSGRE